MILLLAAALLVTPSGPPEAREEAAACLRRGNDAFRAGQFRAAADEYGKAYELFPSTKLLYNLGKAYEGAGLKPQALDAFQRFLEGLAAEPLEVRTELAERAGTARSRVEALRGEVSTSAEVTSASASATPDRMPDTMPATMPAPRTGSKLPVTVSHAAPPVSERAPPPVTLRETPAEPSTLYRLRWWAVGAGAVVVGAATTFFVVRWYQGRCPPQYTGCF